MNHYFNFSSKLKLSRTKRKVSGSAYYIVPPQVITEEPIGCITTNNNNIININENESLNKKKCKIYCNQYYYFDLYEVISFTFWFLLILSTLIYGLLLWITFFNYIIRKRNHSKLIQYIIIWFISCIFFLLFRYKLRTYYYSKLMLKIANHAEIFVCVSLIMVFSTNIAFFFHTPSIEPLMDMGFLLISRETNYKIISLSDIMTVFLPIFCALNSIFMNRENRVIAFCSFFRIASICYFLRGLTVPLTSLPGPAPHCRPENLDYNPPENWIDIVTRVGPMHGKFNTCGDLIFSGHMCYCNSAMLLYLRYLDRFYLNKNGYTYKNKIYSIIRWLLGGMYLILLAFLCIKGRKHYTVDIVLGFIISTLVFFHFEHSWIPSTLDVHQKTIINNINTIHDNTLNNHYNNTMKMEEGIHSTISGSVLDELEL